MKNLLHKSFPCLTHALLLVGLLSIVHTTSGATAPTANAPLVFLAMKVAAPSAPSPEASTPPSAASGSALGFQCPHFNNFVLSPMMAQVEPGDLVRKFLDFLQLLFVVIGGISIAYGGYEMAVRGRVAEALLCILGGLFFALAIPLVKYFMRAAGMNI